MMYVCSLTLVLINYLIKKFHNQLKLLFQFFNVSFLIESIIEKLILF